MNAALQLNIRSLDDWSRLIPIRSEKYWLKWRCIHLKDIRLPLRTQEEGCFTICRYICSDRRWNHQKITDVLWYNHHYTLGRLCIIHKVEHISHGDKKMKTDVTVQSKPLWIWMCLHIGLYAYFPFHHNLANFTEIQSSDHQLSINTAKVSTQTSRYISFHLVPGWIDFFRRYVHEVRYISAPFRDSITSRDDGFCCCRHIQKQEWR